MSTTLVIGGLGYIGRHLLRVQSHENYVVVNRGASGFNCPQLPHDRVLDGKLSDTTLIRQVVEQNDAAHLLILGDGELTETVVQSLTDVLADAWSNSFGAGKQCGIIYASTAYVYDGPYGEITSEQSRLCPRSAYARSKLRTEHWFVRHCTAVGLPLGIARIFNVGGGDADLVGRNTNLPPKKANLFTWLRNSIRTGDPWYVNCIRRGSILQPYVRDFVHVFDVCTMLTAFLTAKLEPTKATILNCGSGKALTLEEVGDRARQLARVDLAMREVRQSEPLYLKADLRCTSAILRWTPVRSSIDCILQDELNRELN